MEICFYHISNDYISFLKKYEREQVGYTCVPNIQYKTSDKFVFGAVMNINGINYFVPVSSYAKDQADVILMRDKKNKSDILGSLRFAYMLPVPRPCLIKLDINSITNAYSKTHISKELAFCRRERDKIFKQAEKTYFRVTHKVNEQLVKNSCDFKILEQAYIEYCIEHKLECPQVSNKDNNFEKLNEIYANVLENIKTDNVSLPTSLENTEDRVAVSQYIIEQLNSGETTEVQRKSLEKLRDSIREAEEPLFKQRVDEMSNWADYVIEKAEERNKENDEQDRNDTER